MGIYEHNAMALRDLRDQNRLDLFAQGRGDVPDVPRMVEVVYHETEDRDFLTELFGFRLPKR